MNKLALVIGILCCVVAVVIFIFADGMRRWYSGIFFALIGTVTLVRTLRLRRGSDE